MEESCSDIPTFNLSFAVVNTEVAQDPKTAENRRETKRRNDDETDSNINPKRVRLFASPDATDIVYPNDSGDNTPKLGASHKWGKQELDILGVTFIEEPFDLCEITGDSDAMWSPEFESCKITDYSC
jgi:hypothetical protein